jgi:hypothetical protein
MGLHNHDTSGHALLTIDDLNVWLEHVFLPLVYGTLFGSHVQHKIGW